MIDFAKLVLAADTSQMKTAARDLEGVSVASGRAERAAQGLVRAIKALSIGYAANLAIRQFTQATIENQRVQAQLAAAIESTGGAAQRTQEQLNATAATLQGISNYGDEAINAMQGLLLTFTRISGANFDRATKSILDVSTAMGTDLRSAALQVGKALNDPILGLTALSRSGIQFSDAQKETIRSLMELGDVAGAQTVILEELERQFGGSAEAARGTLGGALTSLGNAWGDLFELSGDASENLRESIEGLIRTIQDPAFVSGVQAIGAGIFNVMTVATQAVAGLNMAFQDAKALLGFQSAQQQVASAVRTSTQEMQNQIRSSGALATQGLGPGAKVSLEYATAQLEIVDATVLAIESQLELGRALVRTTPAYIDAQREGLRAAEALENLVRAQSEARIESSEFGKINPYRPFTEEIAAASEELLAALDTQIALMGEVGNTTQEYRDLVATAESLRAGLDNAADGMVILKDEVTEGGQKARELSVALANITMASQARLEAVLLAQQLGINIALAERLNATLDREAGLPGPEPRLGFGLGSTLDDPLANGLANTVLGFGNVTQAADETWRSVTDLTVATNALAAATGGGGAAGTAGELADALSIVVDEGERAKQALEGGPTGEAKSGGGFLGDMTTEVEALGNAFEDFIESGMTDFRGFTDDLVRTFSRAVSEMVAEAAAAQLGQSLGMFAGPVGGIVGSIAGSLLGGLFGGGQKTRYEDTAQYDIDQERMELTARNLELLGREDLLRKRQLQSYDKSNRALAREVMALEDAIAVEAEAARIQQQIWQLTGDTTAIREAELAALDPANRALQERVFQLQDEAEAAAAAAQVQSERMSLEEQRLALLGREDLLREMQLKSLDASNQALQLQIWALEDAAAAAEEVARIEAERTALENEYLALTEKTTALRARELKELDPSNKLLQIRIWQLEDEKAITDERLALEKQLLQAQGDTAALRQLELEALDASNQALQKEIWALEDALAISNERLALEKQLLQVQGDTAALRELELQALDASNQALQKEIWALEDQAAAAAEAAAIAEAVDNERLALEKELLTLQGDVNALRALELAALDESNRALQMQIWALEDYQKALEGITPDSYATLIDYNRALAQAAVGMSPANSSAAPSYVNPVSPILAATSTYSGDPLLDEVRAMRQENRDLLIRIDRSTKRVSDITVNWELNGLPEERVA